jgi:hypothetical protein
MQTVLTHSAPACPTSMGAVDRAYDMLESTSYWQCTHANIALHLQDLSWCCRVEWHVDHEEAVKGRWSAIRGQNKAWLDPKRVLHDFARAGFVDVIGHHILCQRYLTCHPRVSCQSDDSVTIRNTESHIVPGVVDSDCGGGRRTTVVAPCDCNY